MTFSYGAEANASLELLASMALLTATEVDAVRHVASDAELRACLSGAETIHLHVKVGDTGRLPRLALEAAGAAFDHGRDGFVKFRLRGAVNAIFSHIAVSEDDLRDAPALPRPFLDHIGIDLRDESAASRARFDAVPHLARRRGWAHVPQGGPGRAVRCCHAEVAEKHWVFPAAANGSRSIPIEFAYGALRHSHGASGCDLRPSHPRLACAERPRCCGV